jgi:hypothetical protein
MLLAHLGARRRTRGPMKSSALCLEFESAPVRVPILGTIAPIWGTCGTFANSGKAIEARLSFKRDLDGRWILFRHDDKPPFSYHALSEWGWDAARMEFVMLVEDSTGGLPSFRSTGLRERKIIWDGDAFQSAKPDQRFIFEVIDSDHFRVSYFRQTDGNWRLVDSSTCSTSVR